MTTISTMPTMTRTTTMTEMKTSMLTIQRNTTIMITTTSTTTLTIKSSSIIFFIEIKRRYHKVSWIVTCQCCKNVFVPSHNSCDFHWLMHWKAFFTGTKIVCSVFDDRNHFKVCMLWPICILVCMFYSPWKLFCMCTNISCYVIEFIWFFFYFLVKQAQNHFIWVGNQLLFI